MSTGKQCNDLKHQARRQVIQAYPSDRYSINLTHLEH